MTARNKAKINYDTMKQLILKPKTCIAYLQGPPIKRRKVGAGISQLASTEAGEGNKRLQWTGDKRRLPAPNFQDQYVPGFRLPIGHVHTSE